MANAITTLLNIFQKYRRTVLKMRGVTPESLADKRVVQGTAWADFCDTLKSAGAALVYPGAPNDPASQAEGLRYLTRLTRAALEAFVEYGDPLRPELRRMVHETVKMGADNPDNYYLNAQIDGQYEYVISGKRNSIHYVGFFTQNGDYGSTGGMAPCGVLENEDLQVEADGTFEVHLSANPKGKNWLKIEPETGLLIVRQTFRDREHERPAEMYIRNISIAAPPLQIDASYMDRALSKAGLFVAGAPVLFARWAKGFQKHTNKLPLFDPEVSNAMGGDANILYYHSHWKLAPDEALVIETPIPDCDMWNFQLNNYWMESLDYRYFNICLNAASAVYEEDGRVRVIVAHEDPGHPNWIQTSGHSEGTMCWRWYRLRSGSAPEPATRIVTISHLREQ